MNRSEFLEEVGRLHRSTERGGAPLEDVDVLMQDLLKTRAAWSHDAMLALVYGEHGNKLASLATICLVHGCKPRMRNPGRGGRKPLGIVESEYVFAADPFARHCLERGRTGLLKAIATRGIPVHLLAYKSEKVDNVLKRVNWKPRAATTDAGDALDVMSATEGTTHESFIDLLMELQSYQFTKAAVLAAGASLLVELDPEHPDVHKVADTPVGALFTEQVMRRRIDAAAVEAVAAPTIVHVDSPEAPRRRLRNV